MLKPVYAAQSRGSMRSFSRLCANRARVRAGAHVNHAFMNIHWSSELASAIDN